MGFSIDGYPVRCSIQSDLFAREAIQTTILMLFLFAEC
jgi:hypothetical protein